MAVSRQVLVLHSSATPFQVIWMLSWPFPDLIAKHFPLQPLYSLWYPDTNKSPTPEPPLSIFSTTFHSALLLACPYLHTKTACIQWLFTKIIPYIILNSLALLSSSSSYAGKSALG